MLQALTRWLSESVRGSGRPAPGCRSCGTCCRHFGGHLRASPADLARWRSEGRSDLLSMVGRTGWCWCSPETGQPLRSCPFLRSLETGEARCDVHETKPEMCRAYPTVAHGRQCVRGVLFR